MNYKCLILMLFVLFLSMSIVSANEIGDVNVTGISDESPIEIIEDNYVDDDTFKESNVLQSSSQDSILNNNEENIIVVNNWDELKYYCAQTDKDYTLKLKENTNFYPSDNYDDNQQINIKNNVKIIGGDGSWIGDSSPEPMQLRFLAMQVKDDSKVGLTLINVTFKWIKAGGGNRLPDGMFLKIGGKKNTIIKNCQFYNIITQYGHSCIVHLNKGTATFENCSIINCTNGYGCLSVFNRNGASVAMIVKNCYFENNYATTEPGCINNCGKLTVYNTTFVKNRSFWWAGAIHTHGGGNTTIYDSSFIDNVAGWNGGALYTYSYLQVYNSVFIGNNCTTDNGGGAIGACEYESTPHIYIEGCLFKDNSNNCWYPDSLSDGPGRGGAISIMDKGSLEVRDTTFIANAAARGTAICALAVQGYGTPDVILVNDSFINHTRVNDVLEINIWDSSFKNISNNYYLGNSIVFSNLTLAKLSEGREQATLQITSTLSNPTYYDEDILDKTLYDVYINNKYVKTVNSTVFSIDFGDLDICDVYVIPTISNRKSNEVTAISTREYVFVSKSSGDDNNNGISRNVPVSSIKRALELAKNCQNIILLDGDYSESNVLIDYDVTIKGEGNATLTGDTSFVSNSNLTLKNLKINNLNTNIFIKQNSNNLLISKCILTNNAGLLVQNNAFTKITNSILLNNTNVIQGNNANLDYNWWGSSVPDLNINKYATLNITSNADALENNQKANVKAVFYLNDGSKYDKLPDVNLDIVTINGVVSQNTTNIDSEVVYTLTAFSDGVLTVNYNNVNVSKTFKFLKSNPIISLTSNDVMFGENVTITVTTPSDAGGNLTVNVGNLSQTMVIQSSKSVFTFENLKADTYTITLTYTGDKKYLSKDLTSTVNVNKYESSTQLNLSAVNVGEDVIITVNTIATSTGNVTLSINNDTQTLTLNNSKANYAIKNIKRGDYLIKVIYNGDDKYLTSQDSKFIEVDNLNATMTIKANDITYGDLAIIKVTLNDDATGNVIVTIDGVSNQSKLSNGEAEVSFTNLEAGSDKNISVFYSGDDTYFNLTKSATFNIAKADLTFSISSSDIKIGQFAEIIITVPQRTSGTFTIGEDVINIPLSGEVSYIIPDLEIGNYTYTATYNGNNYYTVSKTTSFTVSEYPIPQVQNEGLNTQNTHKSQYETLTNGNIAFTIPFDETLSGDLIIDSLGNVYLPTQNGIYAFNQTRQLWYFTSTSAAGNLSGIAIGRDVIIAPKSGDTLYFINQTTGERYGGSNLYQGSSLFAPVVDANATLYISSEYQTATEDYKLTIIPYKLWENGGDPTLISIGNTQPLCSPTLNENIIVIVSDGRLRIIDAKTLQTLAIKSGNYMSIRPIIGEGNVIYALLSDSVVAYNSNGAQVWKTKVSGGVGSTLVLDNEQGLYHVNSRGVLYKYDLVDGKQSKFSSLKVTSGVLVDANNNVYFGSNSMFYALDSEGNVLWKSDLGSKIIGNPVMDASGLIYVPTETGVTALTYVPLSDPDLKVSVDDIVEGQKATITITWNNQTTGTVSYNVNGEDVTVDAGDAKVTKVISGLTNGYYDVSVSYLGDMRFKESTVAKNFAVRSTDDVANNIQFDGNQTFTFSLTNAQGNLTVNVAGKTYSKKLTNGQASITIDKLSPGDWDAVVTYSGDRQFNKANRTFSIEIPKYNIDLNEVITTENIVSRISVALPSDATGNLTLSVGTKKYTETVTNGNALIIVDDLPEGNYTATLIYSGDNNYEGVSKTVSINPAKIKVTLDDTNVIVKSGTTPKVSVKLADNATGSFTVSIDDGDYSIDISEELIISGLEPGNYTGTVTYSGDFRYSKASKAITFEVPKIIIDLNETVITENVVSTVSVSLPGDASGDLTVSIGSNRYTDNVRNGNARVVIDDLGEGNWTAVISYSNDAKYESVTKTVELKHVRIPVELNPEVLSPSETPEVSVTLDSQATGSLTVSVGDSEFSSDLSDGSATVKITGLAPGNYSAVVTYSGDFKFARAVKTVSVEVPKINLDLSDSIYVSKITNGILVEVSLPSDASGDVNVTVNGRDYANSLSNGFAAIDIIGLNPGNYAAYLVYSGDGKYDKAVESFDFEVPKITLQFNDSNLMVSKITSGIVVDIALPADASGNIIVSFDGKNYTGKLSDGASSVKITDVASGNWQANVTYTGNDKYEPVSKVIHFAVDMIDVSFNDTTLSVISPSSQPVVSVRFDSDVTGNITVSVNGRQFSKELVNGSASVVVSDLNPGNYSATITYSGDERYGATEKTIKLEVPRITTTLDNLAVKSNITVPVVSVILPSDATGNLIVNISGNFYTGKIVNGNCSIEIAGLAPGNYTGVVSYSGDSNYTDAHEIVSLEVPKIIINLNDNNYMWNASQISVNLNNATGSLTVEVANKTYTEELTDGSAIVNIDDLNPGIYDVKIIYSGDDVYAGAEKVVRLEIPKIKVNLDGGLTVDSANVNVDLQEDATGEVTVVVSGKSYTKELTDGKATVDVGGLYPGSYNATVIYSGDNKYDSATKTVNVNVPKVATDLNNDTLSVNASSKVSIALPADATGNLTVTVDGKTFTEALVDGKATVNVDGLAPGSYNATVTYSGDNKYDSATKTVNINVPKVIVELNNDTLVIDSTDASSSVSINLPEDATGALTVTVDGKNYTQTLTDGKATVNLPDLSDGSYNITVTYSGDGKYESITKTSVINVNNTVIDNSTNTTGDNTTVVKVDPVFVVTVDDINIGESAVVNLRTSVGSGKVVVNVNNVDYELVVSNGESSVNISDLAVGTYNVVVRFAGDDKFNEATNSTAFKVLKVSIPLTDETIRIPEANSTEYSVSLPSDATGTLTVTVDGKNYTQTLTNGKATVNIPKLGDGSHNITVIYSGDGKYESIVKSTIVNVVNDTIANTTVVKADPVLVVTVNDVDVGESVVVNVKTSVESGKLVVNVNNKDYELVISGGESSLTISDLAVGKYDVVAKFAGDDKFNEATNSTSFSVLKVNVPVTNETISIPESDATEYSVSLPSDATGTLTVIVDGKKYSETLTNGKATVTIPELSEGSHNITVTYSGDGKYSPITKSSVVVKNPANSTDGNNTGNATGDNNSTSGNNTNQSVSIPDDALSIPESGSEFSISLPSDATGTLTVTVDGVPYSKELVNGKATVSIPELAEGSHNITVTYSGDGKYAPTSKSSVVVKEHVPVIKLTGSNLSMLYSSGKYFKVRLTSDNQPLANQKVKITINGKTYTRTTNKNGYASMKISLAPKAYSVKAAYGNVTITKKVTVKSIITAKNVNAKKSAKTVKIKVTLKKVNGKYLKNKKVTLKFNKKTYKVKTNKKGVATFTIKNSVFKKLKTNKKYAYQVIYGKDKVKKTIKFKK